MIEQSAEPLASANAAEISCPCGNTFDQLVGQTLVISLSVVMLDVLRDHPAEMTVAERDGRAARPQTDHASSARQKATGIVDGYDAMTKDRPYKAALEPEEAFNELRRETRNGWKSALLVASFVTMMTERLTECGRPIAAVEG